MMRCALVDTVVATFGCRGRVRCAFAMIAVALSLLAPIGDARTEALRHPRLQGTFIQLFDSHEKWTAEDWAQLFNYFRRLHLSQVIVQWTVLDNSAYFSTSDAKAQHNSPLETILRLADAHGMAVLVGLVYDSGYWSSVGRSPVEVEKYLRQLQARSAITAAELTAIVQKHRSFAGWYITQEVDDVNWQQPAARRSLFSYFKGLGSDLHNLTPTARIAMSGFSNARMNPSDLGGFWSALLREAPAIDLVLFQDGIGAGKLQFSNLPQYLAALRKAVDSESRELHTILEVFRQVGGEPLDNGPFRAVPATLSRILRQLDASAPHSAGNVAFSIPEYLTPLGGPAASELYTAYVAELQKGARQKGEETVVWQR